MPRLKLCLIKHGASTSTNDPIVSVDNENESMENDVE
jgi:hypothetical protein